MRQTLLQNLNLVKENPLIGTLEDWQTFFQSQNHYWFLGKGIPNSYAIRPKLLQIPILKLENMYANACQKRILGDNNPLIFM